MEKSHDERWGIACHEAGHAVVLHAYNVPVEALWVVYSEEKKDWHGGTEMLVRASGHLSDAERVAILAAGRAAEELFQCRAHSRAWLRDFGEIASLLDRKGVGHELWRRIDRGDAQARAILSKDRDAAIRLIDWLVEHGRIERDAFEGMMRGETT